MKDIIQGTAIKRKRIVYIFYFHMMKLIRWSLFSLGMIMFCQCAQRVPPTGGPVDQIAPQIVKSESTPNGLTNFKPDITEFTFDEYIILKNPDRNIVISPPLSTKPEFYLSGKTVVGDWSDVDSFRENTTYTVNLANAIEDLNEGNPLTDFTFAFSTGPVLDSLRWKVNVLGPEGEPAQEATVMLYKDFSDSVVSKQLPFYFARTNESGIARFQFLKEGLYKVVGLNDANLTLTYDLPSEAIGFLKEPVEMPADTQTIPTIRLFIPDPQPILARNPFYFRNKLVFVFSEPDTNISIFPLQPEQIAAKQWIKDSLFFWPTPDITDSLRFRWEQEDTTLFYAIPPKDSFQQIPPEPEGMVEFFGKNGSIRWDQPIERPNDSIFFRLDSNLMKIYVQVRSHHLIKSKLILPGENIPGKGKLLVLPEALRSIYGYTHKDTIQIPYQYTPLDQLGEYQLILKNADTSLNYIGRIIQGDKVLRQKYFNNDSIYHWNINALKAANYSLHLIVDKNNNRRKDGGNYWKNRKPELPVEYALPELKTNWTIKEEIDISNAVKSK